MLQEIFPDQGTYLVIIDSTEIKEDFNHPSLLFTNSNRPMQLDVFLPSLAMAFEYQGAQHFRDLFFFGSYLRDPCDILLG